MHKAKAASRYGLEIAKTQQNIRSCCDSIVLGYRFVTNYAVIYLSDVVGGLVGINHIESSEIINLRSGSSAQLKKIQTF